MAKKEKVLTKEQKKKVPFNVLRKGAIAGILGLTISIGCLGLAGCSDGKNGKDGSQWYSGTTNIELVSTGNNGDFYYDTDDYKLYQKENGSWVLKVENFGKPGTNGTNGTNGQDGQNGTNGVNGNDGSSILFGTTTPANTEGKDGDMFLNKSNFDIYEKVNGAWSKIGNIKGEKGDKGDTGESGSETNILAGKSILAIGDSYVKGHTSPEQETWVSQLATRNKMTKYIYAQNGISVANSASSTGLVNNILTITSEVSSVDYIVFLAGHNDANASLHEGTAVPIGENSDTSLTTYKGALNTIIGSLQTKYPTAKILFLTPFNRYGTEEQYSIAMQEVCAKWSVPCFDNYHNSGINWQNQAQKEEYESSNLHFNQSGHERISYIYESILKNNLVVGGFSGSWSDNKSEDEDGSSQEKLWGSDFTWGANRTRACATINLKKGQKIDFLSDETWLTYKYACGLGDKKEETPWIGGGYQVKGTPCSITEDGLYTIMFAKQDNSEFSLEDFAGLKDLISIN